MMFTGDIVICSKSREQVDTSQGIQRYTLERGGKVTECKTECVSVKDQEGHRMKKMQAGEVVKVDEFRYLG